MKKHSLAYAQQNRKINTNNKTGYKNIRFYKNSLVVEVGGVYVGCCMDLDKAIAMRDKERARVFTEVE